MIVPTASSIHVLILLLTESLEYWDIPWSIWIPWNIWNIPSSGIFPWCVNSQGVNIPLDNSLVPVRVNVLLFFLNHKYIHEGNLKKKKKKSFTCLFTQQL